MRGSCAVATTWRAAAPSSGVGGVGAASIEEVLAMFDHSGRTNVREARGGGAPRTWPESAS